MKLWWPILALLAACSHRPPPTTASVTIPPDLQTCALPQPGAPLPKQPRSTDSVFDWARLNEKVRARTADDLTECRLKLIRLNAYVNGLRSP